MLIDLVKDQASLSLGVDRSEIPRLNGLSTNDLAPRLLCSVGDGKEYGGLERT